MDLVKVFEAISTSSASSSSSSSGRSIETGAGLDNGGLNGKRKLEKDIFSSDTYASPRKRRRAVRRERAVTGTPLSGWANRTRPSSPSTSAGTSWSPRLGVPRSGIRGQRKEPAITEPEGATSRRSGPLLTRSTPSSPPCPSTPGHTPPPPYDVPHPPPLSGPQATFTVSSSPTGMGNGRGSTTGYLKTRMSGEQAGHVPGGQGDPHRGQRGHHLQRARGGEAPPGVGPGGELGGKELKSEIKKKENHLPRTDHPQEHVRHQRVLGGAGVGVRGAVDSWNKKISKCENNSSLLPRSPPNIQEERRKDAQDKKKEAGRQEERRGDSLFSIKLKNISLETDIQELPDKETHRGCGEAGQAGRSRSSCEASLLSTLSKESPGSSTCSVDIARSSPLAGRRSPSVGLGSIMAADTCRCAHKFLGTKKTTETAAPYGGGTGDNKLGGGTKGDI